MHVVYSRPRKSKRGSRPLVLLEESYGGKNKNRRTHFGWASLRRIVIQGDERRVILQVCMCNAILGMEENTSGMTTVAVT